MAAHTSAFSMSDVTGLHDSSSFFSLTQEMIAIVMFFASFIAWREFRMKQPLKAKGARGEYKVVPKLAPDIPSRDIGSSRNASASMSTQSMPQRKVVALATAQGQSAESKEVEQKILKHLEQHEFTHALNTYRGLERDGHEPQFGEEFYAAFIQSAIRVGKIDVVDRLFRAMKRTCVTPSTKFWQSILRMLSSRKIYNGCMTAYIVFGKLLPADKVVFSCIINAALETSSLDRCHAMLQKYGEASLEPKDHVLFFRAYAALGDVDSGEAVFEKLGASTTPLMLNLLLLTCVNTKQVDRGLELIRKAHEFERHGSEKIVDTVSYNTVIKGFAQRNSREECLACVNRMLKQGLEPDDITFGTLLDTCLTGSREQDSVAADEFVGLLTASKHRMDTVMCTLFLKAFVRLGWVGKALEMYEEMRTRDCARPDIITYSVLIKGLVDHHDLEPAMKLVEDMSLYGLSIDDVILTHLLEGCRYAGKHAFGKQLFADCVAAGVKPSEFTLITLLKLHGCCGAHQDAYNLLVTWRKLYGMAPSVIHYTCLISGCLRTKSYEEAWSAYILMCSNGIAPDDTTISTILPAMVAAQRWDNVLHLAQQVVRGPAKVALPAVALNCALSQLLANSGPTHRSVAASGDDDDFQAEHFACMRTAMQLRTLMQEAGIPITTMRTTERAAVKLNMRRRDVGTPATSDRYV